MPTRDSQGISKVEFGPFRLDAAKRVLWRDGRVVPLPPKALDVLVALVEQRGDVVTKDELLKRVWPDTFVEEANLSVNVSALRKALGDGPGGRPYIETLSRRGYRFAALEAPAAGELPTLAVQDPQAREKCGVVDRGSSQTDSDGSCVSRRGRDVVSRPKP